MTEQQLDLPVIGGLYKLVISHDAYSESPRDWDNLGKFCVPNRCRYVNNEADVASSLRWESAEEDKKTLEEQGYIVLPLSVYDHSGVHIWAGKADDDWDSGQIGWYIAKKGTATEDQMIAEVEEYNAYINGEVYQYELYHGEDGLIDDCGGFYSIDSINDYLPIELNQNQNLDLGVNRIDTGLRKRIGISFRN